MINFTPRGFTLPQVYESAELQDNLEHSGGITISWKSKNQDEIPIGSYVTYRGVRYVLLDPYAPNRESKIHWKYDVQFKHPQNMLDRIPFWIKSKNAQEEDIDLKTTSYTGFPHVIAQKIVDFMAEYANKMGDAFFAETVGLTKVGNEWQSTWTYDIYKLVDEQGTVKDPHCIISVSFDNCSIKSAIDTLANAMGCNVYWDWTLKERDVFNSEGTKTGTRVCRSIKFVAGTTIQGETFNCFHVLGGTTNMGKNTVSGGFAAVTQRLTLNETQYPGSIIKTSQYKEGGIMLTKGLYFDDIYPKMELKILETHQRICRLTDENGDFIVDRWVEDDSADPTKVVVEIRDGKKYTPVYKTYAKWYVKLGYMDGTAYTFDQSKLIDDKPLSLLFQIDYSNPSNMSALVGNIFELTYFPNEETQWDKTDEVDYEHAYKVPAGWFRVAFTAINDVILPAQQTAAGVKGMYPYEGDKVTLVNMALGDEEKAIAQTQLLAAANEIIGLMNTPAGEYQEQVILSDLVDGEQPDNTIPFVEIGGNSPFGSEHGPVVTNISQNLDTNIAEVTVGSWTRKTKTGGTADKLETVTVSANASTTGGDAYSDGSIGPGYYNSNNEGVVQQTTVKPTTLLNSMLSPALGSVDCTWQSKVKADTDLYARIWCYNGTTDITDICNVVLKSSLGSITVTREPNETTKTENKAMSTNIAEHLGDDRHWLRIHIPKDTVISESVKIEFTANHPYHGDRTLTFEVLANVEGMDGSNYEYRYKWTSANDGSATQPPAYSADSQNPGTGWGVNPPNRTTDGTYLWMIQALKQADGTLDPSGVGGHTWGDAIRLTGDTGTSGEDGSDLEWIYKFDASGYDGTKDKDGVQRTTEYIATHDDFVPYGWYDTAQTISKDNPILYASFRRKPSGRNQTWGAFQTPIIWSHWGRNGMDGDGVEFVFMRTTKYVAPILDSTQTGYDADEFKPTITNQSACGGESGTTTDEPTGVDATYKYEWAAVRTKTAADPNTGVRAWQKFTGKNNDFKMSLWRNFSENAVRIDIDNEADMVQTDSTGKVIAERDIVVKAKIYDGKDAATSGVTAVSTDASLAIGGCTPTLSLTNGELTITWAFTTSHTIAAATPPVTITLEYNNVNYSHLFTLSPSLGEAVYQLKPSMNSIPFQRDANNNLTPPSQNVGLSIVKLDKGSTAEYTTASAAGVTVKYSTDSMPSSKNDGSPWTSGNISVPSSATNLYIAMFNSAGVLLDRETIPCVKDGKDADVWTIGADGYWYKNGVKTGTKAEGKDGTGVEIKGGVDSYNELQDLTGQEYGDCYIVNDDTDETHGGHLYFYQGGTWPKSWRDLGKFKGDKGDDGTTYYYHIAWATSITFDGSGNPNSCTGFTVVKGSTNYAWMGICVDTNQYDPGSTQRPVTDAYKLYAWDEIKGADGVNAIQLTLDNENEDFLYSANGLVAPVGGAFSQAVLYNGDTPIAASNVTWGIDTDESIGVLLDSQDPDYATKGTSVSSAGMLNVKGLTAENAIVYVTATYPKTGGRTYTKKFTAKKVSQDKYDLVLSKNIIVYNTSKTFSSVQVDVYAMMTDISGGVSRATIQNSAVNGLRLYAIYKDNEWTSESDHQIYLSSGTGNNKTFYFDLYESAIANNDNIRIELREYTTDENNVTTYVVRDYENIEIAVVEDGSQGQQGAEGLQGCVVRVSEWKSGQEYRNDEGAELAAGAIGYIDVVGVASNASGDGANYGYAFYRCKVTHTSSYSVTTSDTSKWEALTGVGPIYTSLLVAKYGYIKFGSGNQFVILGQSQSQGEIIAAGMKGSGSIRIWAGSKILSSAINEYTDADIANAPFRVDEEGKVVMTDAEVSGSFQSQQGLIKMSSTLNPNTDTYATSRITMMTESETVSNPSIWLEAAGGATYIKLKDNQNSPYNAYGISANSGFFKEINGLRHYGVSGELRNGNLIITIKGGIITAVQNNNSDWTWTADS